MNETLSDISLLLICFLFKMWIYWHQQNYSENKFQLEKVFRKFDFVNFFVVIRIFYSLTCKLSTFKLNYST